MCYLYEGIGVLESDDRGDRTEGRMNLGRRREVEAPGQEVARDLVEGY